MGTISRLSSAMGMKRPGATLPRLWWFQRSKHDRLVENLELILLERRAQVGRDGAAHLHLLLHLRLEEPPGVAASGLRPVKRHVRVPEKMLGVGRLIILDRNAETDAGGNAAPLKIVGLVDGVDEPLG